MSIPLTVNGTTYDYPEVDDTDWGPEATDWAQAVTTGMLQKAGGLFQLLAEVDFGTAWGIKSLYYKSRAASPALTGEVRLGNLENIAWRNFANDEDLYLRVNASDVLEFDGVGISVGGDPVQTEITVSDTATINLTLAASNLSADIVSASITNSLISASAAIAYSKLNLTGSVVNADLSNMTQGTIKGRAAGGGTGAPQDLSSAQATAILDNFVGDSGSGGTKGLVPAPAAGDAAADKFLKADGTWTAPSGSGDVVGPASSTAGQIARFADTSGKLLTATPSTISNSDIAANAAIAFSKLAALTSAQIIVGNGSNVPTAVAVTGDISLSNSGVTAYAGTVPINRGGTGQTTAQAAIDALVPSQTGQSGKFLSTNGTTVSWETGGGGSSTPPLVTTYTSGSGTHTLTGSPIYIKVTLVGGGGGGGGSGTTSGTAATAGGNSTFGTTLLVANGGSAGGRDSEGGAGGSASLGSGPVGLAISGGSGGGSARQSTSPLTSIPGGIGAASALGGGGRGGSQGGSGSGGAGSANTGGGGGGAVATSVTNSISGSGGGSGGFVSAMISSPSSSYGYTVGSGGSGQTGGTSGFSGGAGGSGVVIVEEYY